MVRGWQDALLGQRTLGTPANLVRQDVDAPDGTLPEAVSHHKADAVRRARLSGNGQWLVYECGPDLYLLSTQGGEARKLLIEVTADDKTNPEKLTTFTSNASEFAVAPNERSIALVVHGEIFVMPRNGGKAKRLTDNPAFDHGISWAPDSKKILFLSDRGGHEDIYLLESDDADNTDLVKAARFKVQQLTDTPEAELGVMFAPNGKPISFLRAGKLLTMKPDGTDTRSCSSTTAWSSITNGPRTASGSVYARKDGSFASELFIVPATGPTSN